MSVKHADAPPRTQAPPVDASKIAAIRAPLQSALLGWYKKARRDLPWRTTRDPYAIWLSEIMLQQTRVDTVIPYFARFVAAYPTVFALAEAPLDEVLAQWSGLGYYRRARMLHAAAQQVAAGGGEFPADVEGLRKIAGIGAYTAGAIASIAFDRSAPLVDGNVARVLSRIFEVEDDVRASRGLARIWAIATELVPERGAGEWNQALMELGAMVCTPREPQCLVCPARGVCRALASGKERLLPILTAKKKPIPMRRAAIVLRQGGAVLLARRRQNGTFGGMWEPPATDLPAAFDDAGDGSDAEERQVLDDAAQRLGAMLGWRLPALHRCGTLTHVLSHRRMRVEVFRASLPLDGAGAKVPPACVSGEYDAIEFVDEAGLARRGVTTLARKIFDAADGSR